MQRTTTCMERGPPNVALLGVPSTAVNNSLNMLPFSAEPSLSTLSTTRHSVICPEEITAF
jgi:hypothetical protein